MNRKKDKVIDVNQREDLPYDQPVVRCTYIVDGKVYRQWFLASELQKVRPL